MSLKSARAEINVRSEIVEGMARAFFVQAYADFMDRPYDSDEAQHATRKQFDAERKGLPKAGPREDWMDHAPATSPEAWEKAEELAAKIEDETGEELAVLYNRAARVCFQKKGGKCGGHDPDLFGHYLAMEAMGHGVSWADDHVDHPFEVPHVEGLFITSRAEALAGEKRQNPAAGLTAKGERMYEHVKDSYAAGGSSEARAKEIAARTVYARAAEGASGLKKNPPKKGEFKKLATATSVKGIEKLINEFAYSKNYRVDPNTLEITNVTGSTPPSGWFVMPHRGGYLFGRKDAPKNNPRHDIEDWEEKHLPDLADDAVLDNTEGEKVHVEDAVDQLARREMSDDLVLEDLIERDVLRQHVKDAIRRVGPGITPFRKVKKNPPPDVGMYGDGTFGHQHTRERCADVIDGVVRTLQHPGEAQTGRELSAALRGEMTDDASEELDAVNWLDENYPGRDAFWGWQDGDFGLWPIEN